MFRCAAADMRLRRRRQFVFRDRNEFIFRRRRHLEQRRYFEQRRQSGKRLQGFFRHRRQVQNPKRNDHHDCEGRSPRQEERPNLQDRKVRALHLDGRERGLQQFEKHLLRRQVGQLRKERQPLPGLASGRRVPRRFLDSHQSRLQVHDRDGRRRDQRSFRVRPANVRLLLQERRQNHVFRQRQGSVPAHVGVHLLPHRQHGSHEFLLHKVGRLLRHPLHESHPYRGYRRGTPRLQEHIRPLRFLRCRKEDELHLQWELLVQRQRQLLPVHGQGRKALLQGHAVHLRRVRLGARHHERHRCRMQ